MGLTAQNRVEVTLQVEVTNGHIINARASYSLRGNQPVVDPSHLPRKTFFMLELIGRSEHSYAFSGVIPTGIVGGTYGVTFAYSYPSPTSTSGGNNDVGMGFIEGHDIEIDDDPTQEVPHPPSVTVS